MRKFGCAKTADGKQSQLSDDGKADDGYQEGFFWSPDSKRLVAIRTKAGQEHKVFVVASSPRQQLQPLLESYDYLKPGDRIPLTAPHLFDVAGRRQIPVQDDLFNNPWSIDQVRWQRGFEAIRVPIQPARPSGVAHVWPSMRRAAPCSRSSKRRSKTFIDYARQDVRRAI